MEWPSIIESLLAGDDLGGDTTTWAMDQILTGTATPAQTAGFLIALRAKGETPDEVAGLVAGMMAHAEPVALDGPLVDTCGTGGDGAHTVNISTMAAVVAAAAGARVVKHGNRASSSKSGSADVLESLGVAVGLPPEAAAECFREVGITFLFAPVFHPAMRHAGPPRRELGVRTVFNMLGPLANPAAPGAQIMGVPTSSIGALMAGVLAARGSRSLVVLGIGGLDELTAAGPATVWDTTGGDGSVQTVTLDPAELGLPVPAEGALTGGTPSFNAEVFRAVIAGERSAHLDPVRDAVALNAAAAIVAFDSLAGGRQAPLMDRLSAALPRAFDAVDSGAARSVLERWITTSQRLSPVV